MSDYYDLNDFRDSLSKYLDIAEWHPSDYQILQILNAIKGKQTKNEVLDIVLDIYGEDILFNCFEGVDNSDINTLLLLATKVRTNGNK